MSPYDVVIADLLKQRDELDRVIAMLRVMSGKPQNWPPYRDEVLPGTVEASEAKAQLEALGGAGAVPAGGFAAPLPTERARPTGKVTEVKR